MENCVHKETDKEDSLYHKLFHELNKANDTLYYFSRFREIKRQEGDEDCFKEDQWSIIEAEARIASNALTEFLNTNRIVNHNM